MAKVTPSPEKTMNVEVEAHENSITEPSNEVIKPSIDVTKPSDDTHEPQVNIVVDSNDAAETNDIANAEHSPVPLLKKSTSGSHLSVVNGDEAAEPEQDFWDGISQYSIKMRRDFRYYFQHPYARLVIAYLVTLCNFLIYAEDPVAHSSAECNIIVVGNVYSFVVTKYPPNGFSALKVILWLTAITVGLVVGKLVIHKLLLNRLFKLQMFQDDMGSFMVMFLTSIVSLYAFSWLYNGFLSLGGPEMDAYMINGYMNMRNSTFMKVAACGTWLGDFFTAWMVTDVMLQERFYPEWASGARRWWNRGKHRIVFFWIMAVIATFIVIIVISTDWIKWDSINAKFLATNELSRAFLASFILVMDLLIVMQDWDFPHFINHFDIKLPGLNTANLKINIPRCLKRFEKITIHITGKWFNYGIIFLVMILDLNMWKNQIFYTPIDYAQCADDDGFIYSFRSDDPFILTASVNGTSRCDMEQINNSTNVLYLETRYRGFSIGVKGIAFIPSLAGFIVFVTLIIIYGRVKITKADPYGGRLLKRPKSKNKSKLGFFPIVRMKLFAQKHKVTINKSVDNAASSSNNNNNTGDNSITKPDSRHAQVPSYTRRSEEPHDFDEPDSVSHA